MDPIGAISIVCLLTAYCYVRKIIFNTGVYNVNIFQLELGERDLERLKDMPSMLYKKAIPDEQSPTGYREDPQNYNAYILPPVKYPDGACVCVCVCVCVCMYVCMFVGVCFSVLE